MEFFLKFFNVFFFRFSNRFATKTILLSAYFTLNAECAKNCFAIVLLCLSSIFSFKYFLSHHAEKRH